MMKTLPTMLLLLGLQLAASRTEESTHQVQAIDKTTVECPPRTCVIVCEGGFETDKDGCNTCKCAAADEAREASRAESDEDDVDEAPVAESDDDEVDEAPVAESDDDEVDEAPVAESDDVACPEVMCMIHCEHGTVQDENGCDKCGECLEAVPADDTANTEPTDVGPPGSDTSYDDTASDVGPPGPDTSHDDTASNVGPPGPGASHDDTASDGGKGTPHDDTASNAGPPGPGAHDDTASDGGPPGPGPVGPAIGQSARSSSLDSGAVPDIAIITVAIAVGAFFLLMICACVFMARFQSTATADGGYQKLYRPPSYDDGYSYTPDPRTSRSSPPDYCVLECDLKDVF